jgi:hypothetical protein
MYHFPAHSWADFIDTSNALIYLSKKLSTAKLCEVHQEKPTVMWLTTDRYARSCQHDSNAHLAIALVILMEFLYHE